MTQRNLQSGNLLAAWLGALATLLYCVGRGALAHVMLTRIELGATLFCAIVLLYLSSRIRSAWLLRLLCIALGSSCSLITVSLITTS